MLCKLKNIILAITGCIILIHNVTPHLHHDELSEEQHIKAHSEADSVLDWIFLGFHNDLGGGHLECFFDIEKVEISAHWNFLIPEYLLLESWSDLNYGLRTDFRMLTDKTHRLLSHIPRLYLSPNLTNRPPPGI